MLIEQAAEQFGSDAVVHEQCRLQACQPIVHQSQSLVQTEDADRRRFARIRIRHSRRKREADCSRNLTLATAAASHVNCEPVLLCERISARCTALKKRAPHRPTIRNDKRPWYKLLNRYHWFVLIVAALGWLFDCLDQQLFILARPQAMAELLEPHLKPDPDAFEVLDQHVRRHRDERLHRRLGDGRADLRHARRPDRPGQDDDDHDLDVLGLHGPQRPVGLGL